MPSSSHPRPSIWRARSVLLAALLGLTLVLAAMLAYEAHDAARSHRATAERALRDYAAVAAFELAAGVTDDLDRVIIPAIAPLTGTRAVTPYERLPAPSMIAAPADSEFHCATAADSRRTAFRLDFRDASFMAAGTMLSRAESEQLADTITAHARAVYQSEWRYAAIRTHIGGAEHVVFYSVKYAEQLAPIAAFGFTTCTEALGAPVFAAAMRRHPLLPISLVGAMPNDSLVVAAVYDATGRALYTSDPSTGTPSPYVGEAALTRFAGERARASLRPRAVEALALGAMPRSRLPLLLALLALTAGMATVAVLQLRRENELARLRSDFISSVSHELRTPLAQILLFAETLSLGRVRSESERRGASDVIVQEGRRLMHLVENILHFSRAERRMTRLAPEPARLAPIVRETIDAWTPLASAADVTVRTDLDDDVAALVDARALRQMLLNLLDNAVKYGPAGQTVLVTLGADARETARITVDDEGDGIPAEERERIWTSFYRLERHANSAVAGSGIGLFVVRELAGLQGGRAWAESAPAGGARFVIELRLAHIAEELSYTATPSRRHQADAE
ncbi:MAG: HAMP domain-containing histidine kinase [Gemmatimonadota bacterium]|nr:HAMP domain-containing histidine kinase [Gemmatimonadota bacterium]